MKLTKSTLKQLVREELEASLEEQETVKISDYRLPDGSRAQGFMTAVYPKPKFPGDEGQYDKSTKDRLKDEYDSLASRRRRLVNELEALYGVRKEKAYVARKKNPDKDLYLNDLNKMSPEISELSNQIGDLQDEIDTVQTRMYAIEREIKKLGPGFGEPSAFPSRPKTKDVIDGFEQDLPAAAPRDSLPNLKKIKESTLRTIIKEVLEDMV